jgi:hypothetical protein
LLRLRDSQTDRQKKKHESDIRHQSHNTIITYNLLNILQRYITYNLLNILQRHITYSILKIVKQHITYNFLNLQLRLHCNFVSGSWFRASAMTTMNIKATMNKKATVETDQSWKTQPTQRHTATEGCMCRIRRLLMMGARVP